MYEFRDGGVKERCEQRDALTVRHSWGDRILYDWLVSIGLKRAKSLTLGTLTIPDARCPDFFRDCIDGDGSVVAYTDRYHASTNVRDLPQALRGPRLSEPAVPPKRELLRWIYCSPSVVCLAHKRAIADAFLSAHEHGILGRGRGGNGYTRRPQKPLPARACGFDSHLRH